MIDQDLNANTSNGQGTVGGKKYNFWGNQEGKSDETTTPNVAAGVRDSYPGKVNPPDMGGVGEPTGARDTTKIPMGVDLPNKTATKNNQGISATQIPSV